MRTRVTLVLAGSLGAVGLALVGCDDKNDRPVSDKVENAVEKAADKVDTAMDKTGDAIARGAEKAAPTIGNAIEKTADSAKRVGGKLRDAVDAGPVESGEVMGVLAATVDATISKEGRAVLGDNLSEQDRVRLGDLSQDAALEARLTKIRDMWTAKYSGIFNLRDPQTVFKDAKIVVGTADDRKMAQVIIPAKNDLPEVRLNMVNEGKVLNSWKIDVPDTMSASDFKAALLRQIGKVEESAPKWPNDPYESYRQVSQQILAAFSAPAVAVAR
jgi:hypothetical protein